MKLSLVFIAILTLGTAPEAAELLAEQVPLPEAVVLLWSLGPGAFIGFARQIPKKDAVLSRQMAGEVMASMFFAFMGAAWLMWRQDAPDERVTIWGIAFVSGIGGAVGTGGFALVEQGVKYYGRVKIGILPTKKD